MKSVPEMLHVRVVQRSTLLRQFGGLSEPHGERRVSCAGALASLVLSAIGQRLHLDPPTDVAPTAA
jgi:hypothetical protein